LQKDKRLCIFSDEVSVIWYRRPGKPYDNVPLGERPSRGVQRFVADQWATWIEALELIPKVAWINPLGTASLMENKIRQLHLARIIGFKTPETIITNDPVAVSDFRVRWSNKIVAKALFSPLIEEEDSDHFIFTTLIDTKATTDDSSVRVCPTIFQRAVLPKIDYRVTVVGRKLFAVRIEGDDIPVDWRTQKDGLRFIQCTLPRQIEELCLRYVLQAGLIFGAIDLIEHKEEFYFLEINPSGEWGWLQKPTGLPIAETLCDTFEDLVQRSA
jgi:glutathione synthase/RimK-type ligase-like ATP-grasp enzyme